MLDRAAFRTARSLAALELDEVYSASRILCGPKLKRSPSRGLARWPKPANRHPHRPFLPLRESSWAAQQPTLPGMVRRGSDEEYPGEPASERCACPAGGSPVSVSTGAPSSRPQSAGRDPWVRAGRQKPVKRREPRSGPKSWNTRSRSRPASRSCSSTCAANDEAQTPTNRSPRRRRLIHPNRPRRHST